MSDSLHFLRFVFLNIFLVQSFLCVSQNCGVGAILFKEDFGGNEESDPVAKSDGVPFVSGLTYDQNPCDYSRKGKYAIRKVGYQPHYEWYTMYDHTFPNDMNKGYFMQVDASERPCTFFQTRIDGLCESTNLYLSMWAMGSTQLDGYENSYLKLVIEGLDGEELSSKSIVVENCKGYWEQFGIPFTVPAGNQSIVFKIINTTSSSDGNDFCLDDIEVRLCTEVPVISSEYNPVCVGTDISLNISYKNDGTLVEPLQFTWFRSSQLSYNEDDWEKIGTFDQLQLRSVSKSDGVYYRVMVSGTEGSTDWNNCSPISDIYKLDVIACDLVVSDTICQSKRFPNVGEIEETIMDDNVLVRCLHTILPFVKDTVNWRMCSSESYKDDNFSIPVNYTPGQYVMVEEGRNTQFCYHHVLNLQVDSSYGMVLYDTICGGETYQHYGFFKDETGVYFNTLESEGGCDSTITLYLTVLPKYLQRISDTISQGETYCFFDQMIKEAGTYVETGVTVLGCDSVIVLDLTVKDKYIPIVPDEYFTPNSDALHEKWNIKNIEAHPDACVRIFDRFGKLLYERVGYANIEGWDGTYRGQPMPSADYWYEINVPKLDRQYIGHFTLIR